ncbi:MAG TPA: hypothetical protein VI461_02655, partial [Chitinophagaceae bacterium]|nr:hypothetical protein [Chitinophagaceae bacterium]
MLSKVLWLCGSAIFFILGALHLAYTFFTSKFDPRNRRVVDEMKNTSPRLTNETTLWKAWIGFNASHSAGAIFFGLINSILAVKYFYIVGNSFILPLLTIITSVFYLWLAKKYWFSIPFISILIAV